MVAKIIDAPISQPAVRKNINTYQTDANNFFFSKNTLHLHDVVTQYTCYRDKYTCNFQLLCFKYLRKTAEDFFKSP